MACAWKTARASCVLRSLLGIFSECIRMQVVHRHDAGPTPVPDPTGIRSTFSWTRNWSTVSQNDIAAPPIDSTSFPNSGTWITFRPSLNSRHRSTHKMLHLIQHWSTKEGETQFWCA